MRSPSSAEQSWNGRRLKITAVTPSEQLKKMHDVIARRALEICESRRFEPGHQLEDWRCAESETVRPLNCGYIVLDDKIGLSTDAGCFEEGEIEICVEPRRLTICGRKREYELGDMMGKGTSSLNGSLIFRVLELPIETEPSQVTARFKGRTLEIDLPKAHEMRKAATEKNAA